MLKKTKTINMSLVGFIQMEDSPFPLSKKVAAHSMVSSSAWLSMTVRAQSAYQHFTESTFFSLSSLD